MRDSPASSSSIAAAIARMVRCSKICRGDNVWPTARIAEAIKARSETDDDVPAIAFALSRRTVSHFTEA